MAGGIDVTLIDPSRAALTLRLDGEREVQVVFGREKLLQLIQALGAAHAQMMHGQPAPPIVGAKVRPSYGAAWYTKPLEDGSAFVYWDVQFGPTGLVLPPDQVEELLRLLQLQVAARQRPPEPGH